MTEPHPSRDDWFLTASGRRLFITEPHADQIILVDIATALGRLCRFGGHTREQIFYSVAQHSVLVSRLVPPELAPVALMHDAPEYVLGDVIRPLKKLLAPLYEPLEQLWWRAICERFGLPCSSDMPPEVKRADRIALITERRDLVAPHEWRWKDDERGYEAHPERIIPLSPTDARDIFIARFTELRMRVA